MRAGLEAAGWNIAFANDIDPAKYRQYAAQFPDAHEHYLVTDVHELARELEAGTRKLPEFELATASFPCTDLSIAGARRGLKAGQSSAFWGFVRALQALQARRPAVVLLENVVGFLTSHEGRDFRDAMIALNMLGYRVDPLIMDARCFVPQSRPRLFVVGIHAQGEPTCPVANIGPLRPAALVEFIRENPGIEWGLRDLPAPPQSSAMRLADILDDLAENAPEWWSEERTKYLYNQLSDRHRAIADKMIARRVWSYGTLFRRVRQQADGTKRSMAELRVDGLAGCLRTPKGGSGRQILLKAGYGRYMARLLTPRECARLMGADDFRLSGGVNEALFAFGDAVCVPVVRWIAENYLNQLPLQTEQAARRAVGT
jgi:DNA (cytosine-5)-methyltransferase 1